MFPFFLTIVIFAIINEQIGADTKSDLFKVKENCKVSLKKANECALAIYLNKDQQAIIPKVEAEVIRHCKVMQRNVKCLEKHSKCYSILTRQIWYVVLHSRKKFIKSSCATEEMRTKFLQVFQCVTKNNLIQNLTQCVNKYYHQAVYVAKNVTSFDQIGAICCAYTRFTDCIDQHALPCEDQFAGYIRSYLTNYMEDLSVTTCVGHSSHEICMQKIPQIMNELENLERNASVNPIRKSVIFPFLESILNENEQP